jgi:RNA polymerase sigma factor (sigma-70 family)
MNWAQASDGDLLAATRRHPDAFAAFYDRYEAAIVGFMVRRVADPELGADLASETFAAALSAAHRYRAIGETAAPWLFTIAHNTLRASLRRGRVEASARQRLGIREPVAYDDHALEAIEAAAADDRLVELLERLPADQRAAIRARVLDERDYREIAASLQTSELVVRKRVSRGLAALRQKVEDGR